jgi:hypothetical protein
MKKKTKVQEIITGMQKQHFYKVYSMAVDYVHYFGLNDKGATAEKYLESLGPDLCREVLDCFSQYVYPELYQTSVLLSLYADYEQSVIAKLGKNAAEEKELVFDK